MVKSTTSQLEIDRLRTENSDLRELVREALAAKYMSLGIDWEKRAEKALGETNDQL